MSFSIFILIFLLTQNSLLNSISFRIFLKFSFPSFYLFIFKTFTKWSRHWIYVFLKRRYLIFKSQYFDKQQTKFFFSLYSILPRILYLYLIPLSFASEKTDFSNLFAICGTIVQILSILLEIKPSPHIFFQKLKVRKLFANKNKKKKPQNENSTQKSILFVEKQNSLRWKLFNSIL